MIKKIINKIVLITLILILCFVSFSYNNAFAAIERDDNESGMKMTLEEQLAYYREQIAKFCETFYNEHHSQVLYDVNFGRPRQLTLQGKLPNKNDPNYYLDCVGWVTFVITRATGIIKHEGEDVLFVASPEQGIIAEYRNNFQRIDINSAARGDILITDTGVGQHVAIYMGNNEVCDMWRAGLGCGQNGANYKRVIDYKSQSQWHEDGTDTYFKYAARIISLDGQHFGSLPDGADIVGGSQPQFQYSGMATTVSTSQNKGFVYYIQKIGELYDYMIGIMFNAMKSIPISIADGIQGIITDALNFLSGN